MADKEASSPEEAVQAQSQIDEAPEYSAFSRVQKNYIISLAAFAGWFSSASSFIYFPAIPALAQDLGESIARINLTVTSYLIVSGLFPSITGNAADRFGRRPVFLVALTVYLLSNVGLALQSDFRLLFFLRMLQSAAISGTFSITYGVLSDLFSPAERGGYAGLVSFLYINTSSELTVTTLFPRVHSRIDQKSP
ncbi:multidrug transporter of the major facilitator superfamily [Diaporthe helianthi]|uniref:Multidrug transporter of the major facilitator superfamily n=1 Tax=Diaporthe helianthi TaxID=158607 RepID=A0A2P5I180_DIAHE|nr:multidrug transporter of the major facilitator superfamily [Diaporthe helianthi]